MKLSVLASVPHRLPTALKTAVIVILGAYLAGEAGWHGQSWHGIGWKALLAAALGTGVWALLYAVNEIWDEKLEQKKETLEEDPVSDIIVIGFGVWSAAYFGLGQRSLAIISAMIGFELLYTHPWARLKKYPWAGPILSGVIGPTLRFGLGVLQSYNVWTNWTLVGCTYAMLLVLHIPGAVKSRVYRRIRDKGFGYYTVSARFVQSVRPLQFLTPLGIVALGLLLAYAESLRVMPPGTMAAGLLLAVFLVTATFTMNDIHDLGSPRGIERAAVIMHDMYLLKFHTKRLGVVLGFDIMLFGLTAISCPPAFIAAATGAYLTIDRAVGYRIRT